jgi:hypothetical protein
MPLAVVCRIALTALTVALGSFLRGAYDHVADPPAEGILLVTSRRHSCV